MDEIQIPMPKESISDGGGGGGGVEIIFLLNLIIFKQTNKYM